MRQRFKRQDCEKGLKVGAIKQVGFTRFRGIVVVGKDEARSHDAMLQLVNSMPHIMELRAQGVAYRVTFKRRPGKVGDEIIFDLQVKDRVDRTVVLLSR